MSKSKSTVSGKQKRRRSSSSYATPGTPEPTNLLDVIRKIQNHPEFKDWTDDAAKERAKELTDPVELHVVFSHLIDDRFADQVSQIGLEATETDHGKEFVSSKEVKAAKGRAVMQFEIATKMPIKLHLTELSRENLLPKPFMDRFTRALSMAYGPLHAALVIGDVTLEWNDTSLVVPKRGVTEPDLQMDISENTAAMKSITRKEVDMKAAVDSLNYKKQMELVYYTTVSQAKMIRDLIEVISKYNRLYTYQVFRRNCQTFVVDAMRAMGITELPKMTGKLKEYFNELRKGRKHVPDEFQTHEELDQYVKDSQSTGEFANLTQHDKEYLLCLYFKFHLEDLGDEGDEDELCRFPNCMKDKVGAAIDGPIKLDEYCD